MFAGLGFGHATKLLWLGDSLNTAKQLVPPGESLVGGFHRNNVLGPAGASEGPGVSSCPAETTGFRGVIADPHPLLPPISSLPVAAVGFDSQQPPGTASSGPE